MQVYLICAGNGAPQTLTLTGPFTGQEVLDKGAVGAQYTAFDYQGRSLTRAEFAGTALADRTSVVAKAGKIVNG